MRIIIFLTTSLAISFLTATPATTESYLPSQILSEGATTCGEFTTQAEMQASRMEWVLGYISGINAGIALRGETSAAERLAGRSFQYPATVIGWLQSYCSTRPLDILATAAIQLRRDFIQHESAR